MNALLDTKIGNDDIESLIENANDSSLSLDGAILLREVGNEGAQVEVLRHLLGKLGGLLLRITILGDFRDSLGVHQEPALGS